MSSILRLPLFSLVLLGALASCQNKNPESRTLAEQEPSLSLLWESPDSLPTNESVLYDSASGRLYVSVIDGQDPLEKDGKGSIALLSKEGKILDANWVSGLNAPKGMAISEGKLYVTDIDVLHAIDLGSGKISQSWPVEGAIFLNDVAAQQGKVYFSDMNTGKVHLLNGGTLSTYSEGHTVINGLAVDAQGSLYGLDASGLKKWNADGSTTLINAQVTDGDGLVLLGEGKYIASRWQGEIWYVSDSTQVLLLDTKEIGSNTADIGFNKEEKMVYVPTFYANKVAAYRLSY